MGVDILEEFLDRLELAIGSAPGGLHEPVFEGNEKRYLAECIDSGYVSSVGAFVGAFEEAIRDFVGAKHAVAMVNGTSALHLALETVGVSPGDEVIVPAMSFVATANAVSHSGAVAHFVDVDYETWGIDPIALRTHLALIGHSKDGGFYNKNTGRPIKAIVPMHTLGHPMAILQLLDVANEFGLKVIEDAAESLGSYVGEFHSGRFGQCGVFSFNGNKTITTGGGGAVVTDDKELADRLRHVSTTARIPHPYEFDHDEVGYNYRMPNINAALGLAQMEKLPQLLTKQRRLFRRYEEAFAGSGFGVVHAEPPWATSNYWLQAITLPSRQSSQKDTLIAGCVQAGLGVRPLWKPLNTLAPYSQNPSAETPVTQDLYDRVICLPSSASLGVDFS